MAVNSKAVVFISGLLHWAKVIGEPRMNYNQDGREWGFELEPNEAGLEVLKKHGLADRIKGKGFNIGTKAQFADREPFIQLKKSEFNRDGAPNTPIRLYDADDNEWDNRLLGNETKADVKLDIRDYGVGKKKGVYPVAIRVTDLVAYQSSEFGGMDREDTPSAEKPARKSKEDKPSGDSFNKDFGLAAELDDEIPL